MLHWGFVSGNSHRVLGAYNLAKIMTINPSMNQNNIKCMLLVFG